MCNVRSEDPAPYNLEQISSKLLPVAMSAKVEIQLNGLLATTTLTQAFTNTTDKPIEAVHSLPIPVDSTLVNFEVQKGDQTWRGNVMPISEADTAYENALENGDSAFQLKRDKDDLITLFLGNLLSKEMLTLKLTLIFPIQWLANQGQLYLPLVMGERYGQSNLLPESEISHSFLANYPFEMTLTVSEEWFAAEIQSPSHPLQTIDDRHYQSQGHLDRDLMIQLQPKASIKPTCQLWPTTTLDGKTEYAGIIQLISESTEQSQTEARDILFLLDCSGSMQGTPIKQLKQAMNTILQNLRIEDRFNLYPFGSDVTQLFNEPMPVNTETLTSAKRYIRRELQANLGGTETIQAMLTALMHYEKHRPVDIFLITDGDIWLDESDISTRLLKAYAQQNNIRFFTVGVGHSVTEDTVKTLAEMSDGSYLLVNPNEDMTFAMQSHCQRLYHRPVKLNMATQIDWKTQPTLYAGDGGIIPLIANSQLDEVKLKLDNTTLTISVTKPETAQQTALTKWVASQRLCQIPETQQADFAVHHQLLSEHTDYLIELERSASEQSDEMPEFVKMPQMQVHETSDYLDMPMFSRRQLDSPQDIKQSPSLFERTKALIKADKESKQIKAVIALLKEHVQQIEYPPIDLKALENENVPRELIQFLRFVELVELQDLIIPKLINQLAQLKTWQELETLNLADWSADIDARHQHIKQVQTWLDENVRVYPQPKTVTVCEVTYNPENRNGNFSVYLDDIKLEEEIGYWFDVGKKPNLSIPMYHSPLGAPASFEQYELSYNTQLAIIKAVYALWQKFQTLPAGDVYNLRHLEPVRVDNEV